MVVTWAVLFAGPNTVLASALLVVICVVGGSVGGWLTRVRLSLELGNQYDSIVVNFTIVERNGGLSISKQVTQTFDTHE
jgi:hypothetical protein